MNAYELADKVDLEPYGIYGEQAANMLRQQADRIAELEKELESAEVDIDVYRHEIAELEKGIAEHFEEGYRAGYKFCANMYESTPQIKELSDEEIKEVIRKHWNKELGNRGMLTLCKAILKKASEK